MWSNTTLVAAVPRSSISQRHESPRGAAPLSSCGCCCCFEMQSMHHCPVQSVCTAAALRAGAAPAHLVQWLNPVLSWWVAPLCLRGARGLTWCCVCTCVFSLLLSVMLLACVCVFGAATQHSLCASVHQLLWRQCGPLGGQCTNSCAPPWHGMAHMDGCSSSHAQLSRQGWRRQARKPCFVSSFAARVKLCDGATIFSLVSGLVALLPTTLACQSHLSSMLSPGMPLCMLPLAWQRTHLPAKLCWHGGCLLLVLHNGPSFACCINAYMLCPQCTPEWHARGISRRVSRPCCPAVFFGVGWQGHTALPAAVHTECWCWQRVEGG